MKNVLSVFALILSSQIALAHPGSEHHAHPTFIGEWAWLIIPAIALIALVWKFNSKTQAKKSEK